MVYGLISLLILQMVLLGAGAFVFTRQLNIRDVDKHDRVSWEIKLNAAVSTADSAKAKIEMIEVSHFNALRSKFEAQNLEIAELLKEVTSLRNEVVQLRTTIASRSRAERREATEIPRAVTAAGPADDSSGFAETLQGAVLNGKAYPLTNPSVQHTSTRRFGAIP